MSGAKRVICDGCNVRGGWEHRCHAPRCSARMTVYGEPRFGACECADCMEPPPRCACGALKVYAVERDYASCPRCPMSGQC